MCCQHGRCVFGKEGVPPVQAAYWDGVWGNIVDMDTYQAGIERLGSWSDVSGSATGMDELNALVADLDTRMLVDLQARFRLGCDRPDVKMMVLLWFRAEVSAWDRRHSLTILQKKP